MALARAQMAIGAWADVIATMESSEADFRFDAMLDRLMQRHHRFTLTGESLRQKPKLNKKEVNPDLS